MLILHIIEYLMEEQVGTYIFMITEIVYYLSITVYLLYDKKDQKRL
ncbi:hypothetical protein SAMN05444673_5509 [Bacillus sp. OV166]|nr:hypothetical protein SAMN05444673_5509 [Bacillus sp. OV166]